MPNITIPNSRHQVLIVWDFTCNNKHKGKSERSPNSRHSRVLDNNKAIWFLRSGSHHHVPNIHNTLKSPLFLSLP